MRRNLHDRGKQGERATPCSAQSHTVVHYLANDVLHTQLDKYRMFYPSQKGLLEQALLFLPKLEQLAAAAAAAAAPPPDFGTAAAAAAAAPPPDFGTPDAARPRPGEAGPSAAPPPVEF